MSATLKKTFSAVDFLKKLLTNRFSHSKIKNVSDRQIQNNLCMREWLSWWSTTLPRSGPRVRVPSRALLYFMGSLDLQGFPFFFSYHFSFIKQLIRIFLQFIPSHLSDCIICLTGCAHSGRFINAGIHICMHIHPSSHHFQIPQTMKQIYRSPLYNYPM